MSNRKLHPKHTNKHYLSVERKAEARKLHLGKYATAMDIQRRVLLLKEVKWS